MITPQTKHDRLATTLGITSLYLKREDMHPYRSHKGRSLPKMIEKYATQESSFKKFAISSSGNAALASALYINKYNGEHPSDPLSLQIFIGNKIPDEKRRLIAEQTNQYIQVTQTERPLQAFNQAIKNPSVKGLRQSTDPLALEGYSELARELLQIPDLQAIFLPVSSGTAAQGIFEALKSYATKKLPEIHIIQTESCHPIADQLGATTKTSVLTKIANLVSPKIQTSVADAIVDQIAFRKEAVTSAVKETSGAGWVVNNNEIVEAMEVLRNENILVSPNGALGVAGLKKAIGAGKSWNGPVVCVICGK